MHREKRARVLLPILVGIVVSVLAVGCSTSTKESGLSLVDEQGDHPAGFLATHPTYAVSSVDQCRSCHGEDLTGGIANTTCFTAACHHGTISGWVAAPPAAQPHGSSAKGLLPGSFGFISCQICHGDSFSGGGAQKPCLNAACHGGPGTTPHPSQWRTGDTYFHTNAEEGNASICARCHLNGNNSPIGPPSPAAPAGTSPGCFNSTLCHGENPVPHAVGDAWVATPPADQPHGNSAKATPSSSSGFAYCRICHGTSGGNFNGGTAQVSCLNTDGCHGAGVQSPHPSQWFQGDTYQHITTDPGNAPACAFCHYDEPNAGNHPPEPPPVGSDPPGCFNGTLCHGASSGFHSTGWFVRPPGTQPHGQSAKGTVSGSPGFEFCRLCHGTTDGNFNGGNVQFSCLIADCHGGAGNSPHPAQWLPGNTYVHSTTDELNAPECGFCHYEGDNHSPTPPPAGSGCFNGTLCHASVTPAGTHTTGWLDSDSAAFHGSLVGSISCENASCHPISGHPTCTTCHFDNAGSRANASLSPPFAHDGNVFSNHREESYASVGNVCENCHQTSRTFRAGAPPSGCGPTGNHPENRGCHYDSSLLDPVLTNPRF